MDKQVMLERIRIIERLEQENKVSKQMIKDALENSETYREAFDKAKESISVKKQIKDAILSEPENLKACESVKENTEEISTLKEVLSAELMDYFQKEKTDEIDTGEGEPRKFKISVRLLPKGSKYDERDNFGQYTPPPEK